MASSVKQDVLSLPVPLNLCFCCCCFCFVLQEKMVVLNSVRVLLWPQVCLNPQCEGHLCCLVWVLIFLSVSLFFSPLPHILAGFRGSAHIMLVLAFLYPATSKGQTTLWSCYKEVHKERWQMVGYHLYKTALLLSHFDGVQWSLFWFNICRIPYGSVSSVTQT